MEPENKSLEKEIPFKKLSYSGSMLNFEGVYYIIVLLMEGIRLTTWDICKTL